ncbi:MAG: phage tail sheath family protein [Verrucomicrobiales bacterium]|nr:phage tail sheath family protein [Verrucomicrobiales bacterium]
MASTLQVPLGAPGIYRDAGVPIRELREVRLDIAAFVGVAPRGPAREPVLDRLSRNGALDPRSERTLRRSVPVAVESFDEYRRLYGGFEGPGLLPYAVSAFFENGGRRAYVVRIVHEYADATANAARVAVGEIAGATLDIGTPPQPLRVRARNEGSWGNTLRGALEFVERPLNALATRATDAEFSEQEALSAGALMRVTLVDGSRADHFLTSVQRVRRPGTAGMVLQASFDRPLAGVPTEFALVEGTLRLDDGQGRTEVHTAQGLSPEHPRWLGATLAYDSQLVTPMEDWLEHRILPDPEATGTPFSGGEDAYETLVPEDFFDATWTPGDDEPGSGITCLSGVNEVSLLVVPDLYSPEPLEPRIKGTESTPGASPEFVRCTPHAQPVIAEAPLPPDLEGLRLDPENLSERQEIQRRQLALVEFAEVHRSFIVLLDVPPRLGTRQILAWRAAFNSAYAAAYHPWLEVSEAGDARDRLISVPPSAFAAGMIAAREREAGVPHGPANVLAREAVDVAEAVSDPDHAQFHPAGINVFLRERDGVRLTAARTLSREPAWRQLSVRRLMILLRLTLERRLQWTVFEPHTRALRAEIRRQITGLLRRLFQAGAFAGATEAESFFVRCDEALNPPASVDAGRLVTLVGVAPSEPIEFIVLRILREGDGTLSLED